MQSSPQDGAGKILPAQIAVSEEKENSVTVNVLRTATPIVLGILSLAVTILIAVVNNQNAEVRALRGEMSGIKDELVRSNEQAKQFATQYTDKMFDLVLKISEKKK